MYVVKKNLYAERNSQKSTLLHNIVNPSKHQDRPNVGAVPGQRRRHGPTLNQHRVDTLPVISVSIHSDRYDPKTTNKNNIIQNYTIYKLMLLHATYHLLYILSVRLSHA